ncbi:hypothetical protein L1D19_21760 [Vibrio natriegens]|uniref:helix-turn-helix domain-containing protein n=1 Tax=Vibrio natriegens TaxID=691 RepID=UPI001EFD5F13|nr:helix-turn-helix domain-containing protein [Vibrio natriegens]MCG9702697.1 hypothetical protein [Vibrio natriegens]
MAIVIDKKEVQECVLQELALRKPTKMPNATPNLTNLLPEVQLAIIDVMLMHTHGNQAAASRMLGINKATLKKIYQTRSKLNTIINSDAKSNIHKF